MIEQLFVRLFGQPAPVPQYDLMRAHSTIANFGIAPTQLLIGTHQDDVQIRYMEPEEIITLAARIRRLYP